MKRIILGSLFIMAVAGVFACKKSSDPAAPAAPPAAPAATSTPTATFSPTASLSPTATRTPTPTRTSTPTPTLTWTPAPCVPGFVGEGSYDSISNFGLSTLASAVTFSSPAAVTALTVYTYADIQFRVAVYSHSALYQQPEYLLTVSGPMTGVNGWNTIGVGPLTLTHGNYWFAVKMDGGPSTQVGNMTPAGQILASSGDITSDWLQQGTYNNRHLSMGALYRCP